MDHRSAGVVSADTGKAFGCAFVVSWNVRACLYFDRPSTAVTPVGTVAAFTFAKNCLPLTSKRLMRTPNRDWTCDALPTAYTYVPSDCSTCKPPPSSHETAAARVAEAGPNAASHCCGLKNWWY